MKKIELLVPDHLMRQVLVLVAEDAKEVHVFDVPDESPRPMVAPAPPIAAKRATKPRTKPDARLETIREVILDHLKDSHTATNSDFVRMSELKGFHPESMRSIANKMVKKGVLIREDGNFMLPLEQSGQPSWNLT